MKSLSGSMARQDPHERRRQLLHRRPRPCRHAAPGCPQERSLRGDSRWQDVVHGTWTQDPGDHSLPCGRLRQVREPDGLLRPETPRRLRLYLRHQDEGLGKVRRKPAGRLHGSKGDLAKLKLPNRRKIILTEFVLDKFKV